MRKILSGLFLCLPAIGGETLKSQANCYWIFFREPPLEYVVKTPPALSPDALHRRVLQGIPLDLRDIPVYPEYVQKVKKMLPSSARWLGTSRWLQAGFFCFSVDDMQEMEITTEELRKTLQVFPFVQGLRRSQPLDLDPDPVHVVLTQNQNLNFSVQSTLSAEDVRPQNLPYFQMVGIPYLHQRGARGQGVRIAVLDAGFSGVDTISAFASLFQDGKLIATWNVPDDTAGVFGWHPHGTLVLSLMVAHIPGKFIPGAPEATYLLIRTEVADSERLAEEFFWVQGAEWADSMGAWILHTSLGYSIFDNPAENHSYADMDGNTTPITIAADLAVRKGMLVIVSAGNAGTSPWKYITAPADGDSVIAVGAVDISGRIAPFSSRGPTSDGRLKPDLVAPGVAVPSIYSSGQVVYASGTSLASPFVTILAACLWSAFPEVPSIYIREALLRSGNRWNHPDTAYGLGIPSGMVAWNLLQEGLLWNVQTSWTSLPRDSSLHLMVYGWHTGEVLLYFYAVDGRMLGTLSSEIFPGTPVLIPVKPGLSGVSGASWVPVRGIMQFEDGASVPIPGILWRPAGN